MSSIFTALTSAAKSFCVRLYDARALRHFSQTFHAASLGWKPRTGDGKCFKNGRQFAAWIGLVPKQRSSGGRSRLLGISKRGDRYLRTLLIHGARAALGRTRGKQDPRSLWLLKMRERRHANVVAVALANKNARIAWGLLASGMNYDQHLTVSSA